MHQQPEATGLAVQTYHGSSNVIPALVMYPGGQFTQSGGWAAPWTIAILPYLEQNPMFAAYNFYAPAVILPAPVGGVSGLENTTVTTTQLAMFLCPSENLFIRPSVNATSNYVGNYGGPGQILCYSGTIVPVGDPEVVMGLGKRLARWVR